MLDYAGVREQLAAAGRDGDPTAREVADAICAIRQRKLPDPARLGNAGSFFKNPIVDAGIATAMKAAYPALPTFPASPGRTKLAAAWLIEQCGLRGHRDGDAGIAETHALVLVNHGHASGAQIWALAQRVRDAVRARFSVELEPEPLVL